MLLTLRDDMGSSETRPFMQASYASGARAADIKSFFKGPLCGDGRNGGPAPS